MTGPMTRLLASGALATALVSPAFGASLNAIGGFSTNSVLSVPLGCAIEQQKVIAITNTTGGNLGGGTLSYDYIRMGDNAHRQASFKNVTIAAGATVKRGIEQAVSCTASYRKPPPPMQMAP